MDLNDQNPENLNTSTGTVPDNPQSSSNNSPDFKSIVAAMPENVRATIEAKNFESFEKVIQSYQQLESLIGADKATVLKIPTGEAASDPANWQPVYDALGVPKDGAYQEWKPAVEGQQLPLSPEQVAELDKALAAKGVTQAGRDAGLEFFARQVVEADKQIIDALDQEKAEGALANQKLWGAKTAQMLAAAEEGLTGVDGADDFVKLMKDAQLYDHPSFVRVRAALAMLRAEDGAPIKAGGASDPGVLTPAEAQAKIRSKLADKQWAERYKNGGSSSAEMQEMLALQKMALAGA